MTIVYSCDTSTLIQSWRWEYRPSVFVGVWEHLERMIEEGTLISTVEVLRELSKKEDGVYRWAKRHPKMFIPLDEPIQGEVKSILAAHPRLVDTRKGRSGADPFVIALAGLRQACVLTDEAASNVLSKPRIPDVCRATGVECCTLTDMFERQGLTFR